MTLKILFPHAVFLEEETSKIVAEAANGSFGLLPNHIDFVTALTAGLLSYVPRDGGEEIYLAVDDGILVKQGSEVRVSTRRAVKGDKLSELQTIVNQEFHSLSDDERRARSAMARLESALARRFIEFQENV